MKENRERLRKLKDDYRAKLNSENEDLQAKIDQLSKQLNEYINCASENNQLKDILQEKMYEYEVDNFFIYF